MTKRWTKERISALSFEERRNLFQNAKSRGSPDAVALAELIESIGLTELSNSR